MDADELMYNAPCGFVSIDDDGMILDVNNTLLTYTGYTQSELEGKTFELILTLASRIFYQTHFYPLLKLHGHAEEIFFSLLSKNKKNIPVLINADRKENGDIGSFHLVMVPVQERGKYESEILQAKKTAEEALLKNELLLKAKEALDEHQMDLDMKITLLEQKNQELLQMNTIISHDLQEPLRKTLLFADILLEYNRNTFSAKSLSALERIKRTGNRMREIVHNLQRFLSLDKATDDPLLVDLSDALQSALKRLSQKYKDQLPHVESDQLPTIQAYPEQMEQVFYHLLENAVKFRSPDRKSVVEVRSQIFRDNRYKNTKEKYKYVDFVNIEVSDNGIGFDNKYSEYIFLILKKLTNNMEDLGFGLAFTKKIVEKHHGTITADGVPGIGSTFRISLPLEQPDM